MSFGGPLGTILRGIETGRTDLVVGSLITLVLLLLIAFPLHELAHAVTARQLGDDTAERLGRITLNPLKHLDPIGTILFVLTGFGWAKPVPVSLYRLRGNPRTSFAIVALAGPLTNIALALIFAVLFRLLTPAFGMTSDAARIIATGLVTAVSLNILLAVFNLIPVPPLDGSRLLAALLPDQGQSLMDQIERYGFFILIALSATGILARIIDPPVNALTRTFLGF
jgi:Zn-dependent protease